MAINHRKICVFDFETDGNKPHACNPVQLAALMIDGRNLNIVPKSEFNIDIKPPDIESEDYVNKNKETIEWHAKQRGVEVGDVIKRWKAGTEEKTAWKLFVNYVNKYNPKPGTFFTAPMTGGMNITEFDLVIIDRLMKKYGTKTLFWRRDKADILNLFFWWFEDMQEPTSYSMDVMRKFFDIDSKGSHDALKDVRDTTGIIIRFLKLHRNFIKRGIAFKGAFKDG